jgi:hypothetical protein
MRSGHDPITEMKRLKERLLEAKPYAAKSVAGPMSASMHPILLGQDFGVWTYRLDLAGLKLRQVEPRGG